MALMHGGHRCWQDLIGAEIKDVACSDVVRGQDHRERARNDHDSRQVKQ